MNKLSGKQTIYSIFALLLLLVLGVTFLYQYVDFSGAPTYSSDGCSLFPDSIGSNTYQHCCESHDRAYFTGGTASNRLVADSQLYSCVRDESLAPLAWLMYWGVRIGGTPYLPTNFRWGFGSDYGTYYQQ